MASEHPTYVHYFLLLTFWRGGGNDLQACENGKDLIFAFRYPVVHPTSQKRQMYLLNSVINRRVDIVNSPYKLDAEKYSRGYFYQFTIAVSQFSNLDSYLRMLNRN